MQILKEKLIKTYLANRQRRRQRQRKQMKLLDGKIVQGSMH